MKRSRPPNRKARRNTKPLVSHHKPPMRREARSHFNASGRPKLSYLTAASAERAAASADGLTVYRCTEYGCLHVGHGRPDGATLAGHAPDS